MRLISRIETNFSQQIQAREQVINQVEANIGTISNPNQLLQIAQTLGIALTNPDAPPDQLKQQIQQQLPQLRQQLPEQGTKAQNEQIHQLIRRSIRSASQLFIIALANALVWFKTRMLKLFLL